MERHDIEKLRQLPIEGVAERLNIRVRKHRCLCPFHDDHTPSCSFHVGRNMFRCWSCGAHGGVVDFAMKVLGKSFLDTAQWLADEHNVILSDETRRTEAKEADRVAKPFDAKRFERYFERPWLSPDACRFLFEKRHLHPSVVRFCRLNSYRDWLQIPYYNECNELIGVQQRYMGTDASQPRFRFPRGERCNLYNRQVIPMLGKGEGVWLGEGPSDVWALLSSGRKALGIPSATILKPHDLETLGELSTRLDTTFHIYPDKDPAGEALYERLLHAANRYGFCLLRHDLPEGCKDFSDLWGRYPLPVILQ